MPEQNENLLDKIHSQFFIFPENFHGVHLPSLVPYIAMVAIIGFILTILPGLIWIERVVIALMQDRPGPNRVGPRGLLQSTADVVKLFFKEDFRPKSVDIKLYYLAPFLSMLVALSAGAVLPAQTLMFKANDGHLFTVPVAVGDVNIGLLFILAMSSLGVYGIVLAGWSSNNKYSLLGGLRASAQLISYELSMGLSLLCVIVLAGSVKLSDIVQAQNILPFGIAGQPDILRGSMFSWFWLGTGLIPVVLYTISMIAETNRAPFDLPEAESELIAGFHTEYSSMKFATFFAGEYVNMLVVCALNATMFWGGWLPPLNTPVLNAIPGFVWFIIKIMLGIFLYCWLRATLPRLRYDALMGLGWKRMLPLGLVWLFIVAGYSLLRESNLPSLIPNSQEQQVRPLPPTSTIR
jgi:NADH-quinone oxidoreductase subunit H